MFVCVCVCVSGLQKSKISWVFFIFEENNKIKNSSVSTSELKSAVTFSDCIELWCAFRCWKAATLRLQTAKTASKSDTIWKRHGRLSSGSRYRIEGLNLPTKVGKVIFEYISARRTCVICFCPVCFKPNRNTKSVFSISVPVPERRRVIQIRYRIVRNSSELMLFRSGEVRNRTVWNRIGIEELFRFRSGADILPYIVFSILVNFVLLGWLW